MAVSLPEFRLVTLGTFEWSADARVLAAPPTAKARSLLAFLVANRERWTTRERLIETFWPDGDEARGRGNLKTALWSLRRALREAGLNADGVIRTDGERVGWHAPVRFDVEQFERAADPSAYGGPFLDGCTDEWAVRERDRLDALYERLLASSLAGSGATDRARKLLEQNPYSEDAYATLIAQELDARRVAAAKRLAQRARDALRELDTEPGERLGALLQRVAALGGVIPFVGRQDEMERVREALRHRGCVMLLGQSGIGKTRFVEHLAAAQPEAFLFIPPQGGPPSFDAFDDACAALCGGRMKELSDPARALADAAGDRTIVLDDVHALRGDARAIAIAVAAAARSALLSGRPEARELIGAEGVAPTALHELGPLRDDDVRFALTATEAGTAQRIELMVRRARGYPFYLAALARGADPEGLPTEVRAVADARLRDAGPDATLAAALHALEPDLTVLDIAEVSSLDEERTLDALDELLRRGIVVDAPARTAGVAFAHDLFAEVAGETIGTLRARRLHGAIARRLSDRPEAADPARIARHFERARLDVDAANTYLRASESRFARGAFRDAVALARRGLAIAERDERAIAAAAVVALRIASARAHSSLSENVEARRLLTAAIDLARRSGDPRGLMSALALRAQNDLSEQGLASAYGDALEAIALAEQLGDDETAARAAWGASYAAYLAEQLDEALAFAGRAVEAARRSRHDGQLNRALQMIAAIEGATSRIEASVATADAAVAAARGAGRGDLAGALYTRSCILFNAARLDDALRDLDEAATLHDAGVDDNVNRPGYENARFLEQHHRARIEIERGHLDEAVALACGLFALPAFNTHDFGATARTMAITALLARGTADDVAYAARLAREAERETPSLGDRTTFYAARARALALNGDPRAHELLDESISACLAAGDQSHWPDLALRDLAETARRLRFDALGEQASRAAARLHEERRVAAGAAWGERPSLSRRQRGRQ